MSKVVLFVTHRTLPGKRGEVRAAWERHMKPHIAQNAGHEAYFYCLDDSDPDVIRACQMYSSEEAMREFLAHAGYEEYLREVEPLLARQPELSTATPVWDKEGA